MASPYVGEIRMFGGNFAPEGWAFCNGATMPISQNDTLFNLIQTTYGGNGTDSFNLPDLQGRVPVHQGTLAGTSFSLGQTGGTESVTLTTQQIPPHTHPFNASNNNGSQPQPQNAFPSRIASGFMYTGFPPAVQMNAGSVTGSGGSQPHDNMMPTLTVNFILSLYGVYPNPT